MIMRSATLAMALLLFFGLAAAAENATPLLEYAIAQTFEPPESSFAQIERLKNVRYDLERHPPPAQNCAQTLGAQRFATMYSRLGEAHSALSEYAAALDAYRNAIACTPRHAYLYDRAAWELMHLHRYAEARATAEQGVALDEDVTLNRILVQLDYIDEHWSDAIARLRKEIDAADEDDESVGYWQCFLWLAQRRAGVEHPSLVVREKSDDWPQPILATLAGSMSESELVEQIEDEKDDDRRRQILVEALYYVGQDYLAAGRSEEARQYMASVVNLKVPDFLEHDMALAELAKFRAQATTRK